MQNPIEEIKNKLDIVQVVEGYIKLQKAGANFRAPCPFHSEKTPSFFVSPSRQIWHCFGSCSMGGDIFKFVMQIEGVEFKDALRILAEKAGVELKPVSPKLRTERQRMYEVCELACQFFEKQLQAGKTGQSAKKYLLGRGISQQSIEKYRLGYAPDKWHCLADFLVGKGYQRLEAVKAGLAIQKQGRGDCYDRFRGRIMFPILDLNSKVIAFGGRVFKKNQKSKIKNKTVSKSHDREILTQNKTEVEPPKYINTPSVLLYNKSRILYGLDKAKVAIRKQDFCILTEGYTDVIMVSQAGFENVAATSGTALTSYQLQILKRYSNNLFTAFDMDIAGNEATKRGIDLAQTQGFDIKVITMPEKVDPADIAGKDLKLWKKMVDEASSILDFYFKTALARFDKKTSDGKKQIANVLLPAIKKIPNKIEQSHWAQILAKEISAKEEDVREELQKIKITEAYRGPTPAADSDSDPVTDTIEKRQSRRELLEERMVALIVHSFSNLNLLKKDNIKLLSPKTIQIVEHFQKKKKPDTKGLASDMQEFVNKISLASEITEPSEDSEVEFKQCLKEIRTLEKKKKLDQLSQDLKAAELENNQSKIQKLIEKINSFVAGE